MYLFPLRLVEQYRKNARADNLSRFLIGIFGADSVGSVSDFYGIGNTGNAIFSRTETQRGKSDLEQNQVFKTRTFSKYIALPYIDYFGRCRGVKIMDYTTDGHRKKYIDSDGVKHPLVNWLHSFDTAGAQMIDRQKYEFHECFFGENLIRQTDKYKFVGIVESEKTALCGRIVCPDVLFIAVGGKSKINTFGKLADLGLKDTKVIFYPDCEKDSAGLTLWETNLINWQGCGLAKNWRVSKVATELLADGQDIADKLTTKNNNHFIELLNNELNTIF